MPAEYVAWRRDKYRSIRRGGRRPGGHHDPRRGRGGPVNDGLRPLREPDRPESAGLGDGFIGHSGRVGMAQDLVKSGVEMPALMTAGRWKSSKMPARYTERQAADRGAVARYYQEGGA